MCIPPISTQLALIPTCDLKNIDPSKHHNITGSGLQRDPLNRTKKDIDGKDTEEVMKLCERCYRAAFAQNHREKGLTCDLQSEEPSKLHNIVRSLVKDPLNRKKIDGEGRYTQVMKLCHSCYQAAFTKKQREEGQTCDLQAKDPSKPHKSTSYGLRRDPLKRTKKDTESRDLEEVMKLCSSCYQAARAEKQREEGLTCDLQSEEPSKLHNVIRSLVKDPLKRKRKDTAGRDTEEVMKLCHSCYKAALAQKQREEGQTCAFKSIEPSKPHKITSHGLLSDPLKRTKKADGQATKEIIKLCESCYKAALHQMQKLQTSNPLQTSSKAKEDEVYFDGKRKKVIPDPVCAPAPEIEPSSRGLDMLAAQAAKLPRHPLVIKSEPIDDEDSDCEYIKRGRYEHKIDNHLPILQAPTDPMKSLLPLAEKATHQLRVTKWGEIQADASEKKSITEQARKWIELNEHDRDQFAQRLEDLMESPIPIDPLPYRGRSVFAKRAIRRFEVIGPYSGALLRSEEEIRQSIRHKGSYNATSYFFATREEDAVIDAFNRGNITTLINTAKLPKHQAIAENNISAILVGNNITMLVANKDIAQGEELFLDYGDSYDPMKELKAEPME